MKRLSLLLAAAVLLAGGFLLLPRDRVTSGAPTPVPVDRASTPGTSAIAPPEPGPRRIPTPLETAQTLPPAARPAIAAFNDWLGDYLAATPEQRPGLIEQGLALAAERRVALRDLIEADPRAALENSVPPVIRQELPLAIAQRLEERVNERGFYGVLGALPAGAAEDFQPYRREVRTNDGGHYQAFVYGRRLWQQTMEAASIVGIAVDDRLALDERPLRIVAPGEIPNHPNNLTRRRTVSTVDPRGYSGEAEIRTAAAPARPLVGSCPVSGKSTRRVAAAPAAEPVAASEVVVEAGGEFHFLCSGGHITTFEEGLVAGEGSNGGPTRPTTTIPATVSTGYRTHLLMRVAFPENRNGSVTEKEGHDLGKNVQDWFVDSSAGRLTFLTTVTPLLILPRTEAWYRAKDTTGNAFDVLSDARAAAREAGFDWTTFDYDTVIYTGGPGSFGGQAYVGARGCWLKSGTSTGVAAHEYGHNFGLWHANFWSTTDGSPIGSGSHVEYGDTFDTMGSASAGDLQFNANHKNRLNWIPNEMVANAGVSGTYRIHAMDQPRQDARLRYAVIARKDSSRSYWVDLRQRFASNAWVQGGVFLHWSPWTTSAGGSHLLDMTPGSVDGRTDATLIIGRTFSDREAGVHITPIARIASTPPAVDVVVNYGPFPGNSAPTLALSSSSSAVATNAVVTFTATAADVNRDALSYAWEFSDKSFSTANTPSITKSWAAAGEYRVRCTVSDMKGETTSRSMVVRVGSPTTFRVSGTVTANGQPLADVRVHNGLTGTSYREAYTDVDGSFTLVGLAAATYNLGAQLPGYSFPTTSVTVGPSASGIAIAATDLARVSLSVVDGDLAEGTNTATVRLTRTGPTTNALVLQVITPSGTAVRTTDYTLTPDLAAGTTFSTLTIPAGQSTTDVVITAVDDTTTESFETIVLTLAPGAGYSLGESAVSLVIRDNETNNQLVRLRVDDRAADEAGNSGRFVIERVGATAAALTVNFSMSGTATVGTDYASLGSSVVIPAGASSVALDVVPIGDTAIEPVETVILTLSTSANYTRSSSSTEQSGTIFLADDDQPQLTVVATDATATEAGETPGVFTIYRTGSTTLPLTVSYGVTGSALHGADYAALPGTVTIPAGSPLATVVITPVDDAIGEPSQTVVLQLQASNSYALGAATSATVTITDNNDVPYVTISQVAASVTEGATSTLFRITSTGTGTGNITVAYTVDGSATQGIDFTTLPGTISVARNGTASLSITTLQDTEQEGYEQIRITLNADPSYSLAVDPSATSNLVDDELPQVNVSTSNESFSETAGSLLRFYVSRTGATTAALTVNYTLGGTATPGVDYTEPEGSVTIAAGALGAFVDISMLADTLPEGSESVILSVLPSDSYLPGISSATRYIPDAQLSAVPRTVGFGTPTSSISEGAQTATIAVNLSATAADDVTVLYTITGGTALGAGIDHGLVSGLLTIPAGETGGVLTVPLNDDDVAEVNETLIVTLSSPWNARLGTATHTLTITDNEPALAASVGFASTADSGLESTSPALLVVTLSRAQAAPVSVDYSVTGGTATNGTDYTLSEGTLTFAANETVKLIPNTITNDTAVESNETLTVTLSNPTGATLGTNGALTYTITDDDAATVSITAADPLALESGSDPGTFTVTRTGPTTAALTVNLTWSGTAVAGADYQFLNNSVTIPAGAASATITITPVDDMAFDGDKVVTATVAPGVYTIGPSATASVTIFDDESVISVVASDPTAVESGDPGQFTVQRSGGIGAPVTVFASLSGTATPGSDYQPIIVPISFPAGAATLPIVVTPLADALPEVGETITLTIEPGAYSIGSPNNATVTIADRPAVTILPGEPVAEGGLSAGSFIVARTGPTSGSLTVTVGFGGTATPSVDYAAGTSVTIPAGESSVQLVVTPLADSVAEGVETITATLQSAASYVLLTQTSATISLLDLPADTWRTAVFGPAAGSPEIAGDNADPDFDGISNLLEYALGQNPLAASPPPELETAPGTISLIYTRNLNATDVTYTLLHASAPQGPWSPVAPDEEVLSDNGNVQVVRVSIPRNGASSQWLRLKVVRPEP